MTEVNIWNDKEQTQRLIQNILKKLLQMPRRTPTLFKTVICHRAKKKYNKIWFKLTELIIYGRVITEWRYSKTSHIA